MSETVPFSPYKGLIPYAEEDALFFFGREQKREMITANLQASRLTVLHGPSGVGKSSVLRAGVAYHLQQLAKQTKSQNGHPEFAVVVFNSWRDDPVIGLKTRIYDSVAPFLNGKRASLSQAQGLEQYLKSCTSGKREGDNHQSHNSTPPRPALDLFIILDQFEEYFLYHAKEQGPGTLAEELPAAINSPEIRVNFLISIREDALAKLERFKGTIPYLFENRLSLEHLDQDAAREAIIKPIDQYNRLAPRGQEPFSIEPALVEAILEQIRTGKVVLGQAGRGVVDTINSSPGTTQIETPYLQLVMTRLWEEEVSVGSRELRLETLTRLGGSARIVRTHLDKIMDTLTPEEQLMASQIFYQLVTPNGTKIAHTVLDLAAFAQLQQDPPDPRLVALLAKLSDNPGRILRPVDPPPNQQGVQRYEIFHDVLAPAVLDWQARYVQAMNQAKAEKRAAREAEKRERDAAYEMRVQQAEELAKAERLRAEEERKRFEAERERAEEQKRRTQLERQRATEEHQRAEEQTLATRRLRRLVTALAVMVVFTIAASVWAAKKTVSANHALEAVQNETERANDRASEARIASELAERKTREAENERDAAKQANEKATHQQKIAEASRAVAERARHDAEQAQTQLATQNVKLDSKIKELGVELKKGESRELAAHAVSELRTDPQLSLLLAIEAMDVIKTDEAEDALQRSYQTSNERAVLNGHTERVWNAAYSPNDKLVITTSDDRTVRIWDTTTYREFRVLTGHTGRILALAVDPSGKLIATEAMDSTAKVWDADTGRALFTLPEIRGSVAAIAFNRDGKLLAVESSNVDTESWEAAVWDTTKGKEVTRLRGHKEEISAVAFSPQENLVATASWDGTARIWNAETGQCLAVMAQHGEMGHERAINSVAFSPNGKWIVTGGDDRTAKVWEVATGKKVADLIGHGGAVQSAEFSSDDKLVVTASRRLVRRPVKVTRNLPMLQGIEEDAVGEGTTARVFDAMTGKRIAVMRGHTNDLHSARFSPDNRFIVTASEDGTACVWETKTGKKIAELRGHTGPVYSVAFDSKGKFVVTASADGTVRMWEPSLEGKAVELGSHVGPIKVAFDPKGRVVTTGSDGFVRVWEATTGKKVTELRADKQSVFSSALSPNGEFIVTASRRGQLEDIDPRPRAVATPPPDTMARLWKANGELVGELTDHTMPVYSVAFSPDGNYIVTASKDNTARVWDIATLKSVKELRGHKREVINAAFSPDSKLIVTSSVDGMAGVWNLATGQKRFLRTGGIGAVIDASFSFDGRFIITGSSDGTAQVWETATGVSIAELRGHTAAVYSASFSSDGKYLVTASVDGTARVWEATTGELIKVLQGQTDDLYSAAISPGNQFVVIGAFDGSAQVFACDVCRPIEELLRLARNRGTRKLTPEQQAWYLHKP